MPTFTELGLPESLTGALARQSITEPFPIQAATIPDALAGRDVLGKAPTGSGKTLAFGLPLLATVARSEPRHPRALVLAPTRELAEQISKELMPLGKVANRWILAIYGGVGYDFQRKQLRRGVDVVVATPGRLMDLMGEGSVSLKHIDIVVIDEADRMADMGFMPQIQKVLDETPADRQTVLFSATLDGDVADLTRRYQTDPVRHEVEAGEDYGESSHYFWKVDSNDRLDRAAAIVRSSTPTIVFTRTRRGADRVAHQLERMGVAANAIHGGRSQGQRNRALQAFDKGRVQALVATDVAARGIHVDGVASVVHYDLPADSKDYLHRSGRTARAGANGVVVSLVTSDQVNAARSIQRSVGLETRFHSPDEDWLTGESGGRVGETPIDTRSGGGGQSRNRGRSSRGNSYGGNRNGGNRSGGNGNRNRNNRKRNQSRSRG